LTSKERHEARYTRRKARRKAKRDEALKGYDTIETVARFDHLDKAIDEASRGVRWKASVQRYRINRMRNLAIAHNDIIEGRDVRRGFICFDICERGKLRHIKSVRFYERVVQKSICRFALYPIITRSLIYDNGASQKGKGTQFAADRLKTHLMRHIHRHGREGYILLIDFHDYFGQADHEALKGIYEKLITDEKLKALAFSFIDAFGDKGLGLGSETSQINAIALRSPSDHYVKEMLRIKGYGAYMDDSYLIHESKEYLVECLEKLKVFYDRYGIVINEKKTKICDLKHGFTFLKTRYFITDTGKIIRKPCRDAISRERRKMKKQAVMIDKGILTFKDVECSYQSWRGSMSHRNAHETVRSMDKLYDELILRRKRKMERNQEIIGQTNALKQLLTNTDYMSHKFADGAITEEEYAETKAQRQAWRDQINELEQQLEE
jgi:hypothetical protein